MPDATPGAPAPPPAPFDVAALPSPNSSPRDWLTAPDRTIDTLVAVHIFGWKPALLKGKGLPKEGVVILQAPSSTSFPFCEGPVANEGCTPDFSTRWGESQVAGLEHGALSVKTWAAEDGARFGKWTTFVYDLVAERLHSPLRTSTSFDYASALLCVLRYATPEDYCRAALRCWLEEQT